MDELHAQFVADTSANAGVDMFRAHRLQRWSAKRYGICRRRLQRSPSQVSPRSSCLGHHSKCRPAMSGLACMVAADHEACPIPHANPSDVCAIAPRDVTASLSSRLLCKRA